MRDRFEPQRIRSSSGRSFDLDQVAANVGMRPRNFARRFKAVTGEAPLGYLHRLRIDTAKRPLENARCSVQVISARIGHEDVALLSPAVSPPHGDVTERVPGPVRTAWGRLAADGAKRLAAATQGRRRAGKKVALNPTRRATRSP